MREQIVRQLELLNQNDKILDELYHSYAASVHLSDTAFWILYIAWTQGDGCTQKEICDSWSYSRQTINTALKNLERRGILCLKTAEGNRKTKRIYFSPEGKSLCRPGGCSLCEGGAAVPGETWGRGAETSDEPLRKADRIFPAGAGGRYGRK